MEQKRVEFLLEARQPIAHHSESIGNTSIFMREKVRQRDGTFANVPYITGDTMRHGLREASSYALLDAAGMLNDPDLPLAALRLLFNGGMITGSSKGAVKLSSYWEMVDLIPSLGLLGGCAQNRSIPGKVHCDAARLVCDETMHLLPTWVGDHIESHGMAVESQRAHVDEMTRVRMDSALDPGKRKMLSAGAQQDATERLLASENASEMGDHAAKDKDKSTMMPRSFETLCAGSLFFWGVTATCHSELEVDTFMTMVASFLHSAHVGGKKGTGFGELKPIAARNIHLRRPAQTMETLEADKLGTRVGTLFSNHVQERADKIREFLQQVAA